MLTRKYLDVSNLEVGSFMGPYRVLFVVQRRRLQRNATLSEIEFRG